MRNIAMVLPIIGTVLGVGSSHILNGHLITINIQKKYKTEQYKNIRKEREVFTSLPSHLHFNFRP